MMKSKWIFALLLSFFISGTCWSDGEVPYVLSRGDSFIPDHLQEDFPFGQLKNVFLPDNRVEMTSTQFPWSAVVKIKVAEIGSCTGSLIWKNLVLTNAHCVMRADGTLTRDVIYVYPNYMRGAARVTTWAVHAWWGTSNPNGQRDRDYAVLKLAHPVGTQHGYFGWRDAGWNGNIPSWSLTMAGYSGNFQNGETAGVHVGCHFREHHNNTYYHDCDSSRGSSGGPIFGLWSQGGANNYQIVGLNAAEFREGDRSRTENSYSTRWANIAVKTSAFAALLQDLRNQNP